MVATEIPPATEQEDKKLSCFDRLKMKQSLLDKISLFLGELIGTGLLVLLGCMGCVNTSAFPNNHLQTTLAFGLVVMILVHCFACVSGAHLNPAVTVAALIYELITLQMALVYFVAQMLGAFIGYGLLMIVLPENTIAAPANGHALCVTVTAGVDPWQGAIIEGILTGVLILICAAAWDPRNAKDLDSVSLRFGLGVACLACVGGPFTGGSMNPARSFGPALWNRDFTDNWIYWVGPLIGSAIVAITYKSVFRREAVQQPINNKLRIMEEVPLS